MFNYIVRRLLWTIPTIIAITMLIFVILRIIPGNIIVAMFGGGGGGGEGIQKVDPAVIEKIRSDLKLDRPLYEQYYYWVSGLARGDMGESFFRGQKVSTLIKNHGPVTLEIALISIVVSWLVGVPIGILSAIKQDSWADYLGRFFVVLFVAVPAFWFAGLIVLGLIVAFQWYPPLYYEHIWVDPVANIQKVFAPVIVIGIGMGAMIARMTRSSILEVMREDYVRTARAKGVGPKLVMWRHVLKNAMLPVLTIAGLSLAFSLGGSVAVEYAFSINGLGMVMITALMDKDFATVQNLVLIYALVFVLINLLTDLSYALLDPRIRYD